MRLIDTHDLTLVDVWDEKVVEYAILSHRWGGGEVSFQALQDAANASKLKGFAKISNACKQAINDDLDYIWIDTCCINKESSAELSEAINSMYRWYQASTRCYVLLTDVGPGHSDRGNTEEQIKSSVWFTRGWTLQELIAPRRLGFFDEHWNYLGTKQTLNQLITERTGIDKAILDGEPPTTRSIAQRMSWASNRTTTRTEDTAYCLLGLFDVNMPLLYGEGEKAFLRLQLEIIKESDDHTMFSWPLQRERQPGLLADSPAAFATCQNMRPVSSRKGRSPYSMTNRGLSIKFKAFLFATDTYLVPLDCDEILVSIQDSSSDDFRLCMFLRRLSEDDQYARVRHNGRTFMTTRTSDWDADSNKIFRIIQVNIRQQFTGFGLNDHVERVNGFRIADTKLCPWLSSNMPSFRVSATSWNPSNGIMSGDLSYSGTAGIIDLGALDPIGFSIRAMKIGFDYDSNPVCFVTTLGGLYEMESSFDRGMDPRVDLLIQERSPLDNLPLSIVEGGIAMHLDSHQGLWAVKGDRIDGISCVLEPELAELKILRENHQDKLVWSVYLLEHPSIVKVRALNELQSRELWRQRTRKTIRGI